MSPELSPLLNYKAAPNSSHKSARSDRGLAIGRLRVKELLEFCVVGYFIGNDRLLSHDPMRYSRNASGQSLIANYQF